MVVAHTHWDREWYHPAVRFQARLVALVDALLAAPSDPATPFLLDGQASVLLDYLAIRPERTADIARALAARSIEAGPWFVLADNLIPSGEAVVRNLEAGRRILGRLGAAPPSVAYCPDTFGHPAALPTIAQGFGCASAIVWRGFGGRSFPRHDTAWWHGADGSRILLHHLPPDGYEFGSALPTEPASVRERWARIRDVLSERNTTGAMLLTVGADHHAPAPDLVRAIEALAEVASTDHVQMVRAGLAQAAGWLRQAVHRHESTGATVPHVRGELRDSYGFTWTLQGTLATRAYQKRRNAMLERVLLRDVEPWTALAFLHATPERRTIAADGSLTLAQIPALVSCAWETLLRTHPHDTLCGCSIDHVAADMSARQRDVAAQSRELRDASLCVALAHDVVAARTRPVDGDPVIVLRNRAARRRDGLAELRILETLADVRVGPGSGASMDATQASALPSVMPRKALEGLTWQSLSSRVRHLRRESPQHYPDDDLVREHHVLAWVPSVPASGLLVLGAKAPPPAVVAPVAVTAKRVGHTIELDNGKVRVVASRDGLSFFTNGRVLPGVLSLETIADAGDSYTPSLRGDPERLTLTSVRMSADGPLRATVRMRWTWRRGRERIRVITDITLDAGTSVLRCAVRGDNARINHRLQLCWHTDVTATRVMADAAFGVVERVAIATVLDARPFEQPPTTSPLHRWMSLCDERHGATLLSDGLAEGEATGNRLGVTLVRAIGDLSRSDLPERPGHAGWPADIPAAQCQGPFVANVALVLHGPWNETTHDLIDEAAEAFLLPLLGESWRDLEAHDLEYPGPELHGDGLRASTMRLRDDGNAWCCARSTRARRRRRRRGICRQVSGMRASVASTAPPSPTGRRWKAPSPSTHRRARRSPLRSSAEIRSQRSVDSASPTNVHATTVAISKTPGASAIHGATSSHSRPPAIMLPQLAAGG